MLWGALRTLNLPISAVSWKGAISIIKMTPIYKAGGRSHVSNYRAMSDLPCFSKILEHLKCNLLFRYLKENNILYEKQFGFESGYSTNDALVKLVDKIFNSFEKEQFTLGVYRFVKGIWYSWLFHLTEKTETLWHNRQNLA